MIGLSNRCLPRAPSSARKARAHELVRTRKILRDAKGKPGGSSVDQHGAHAYPYRSNLLVHTE